MIHVDVGKPSFPAAARSNPFCSCVTRSSIFVRFAVGDFVLAMTISRVLYYCHDKYTAR